MRDFWGFNLRESNLVDLESRLDGDGGNRGNEGFSSGGSHDHVSHGGLLIDYFCDFASEVDVYVNVVCSFMSGNERV